MQFEMPLLKLQQYLRRREQDIGRKRWQNAIYFICVNENNVQIAREYFNNGEFAWNW